MIKFSISVEPDRIDIDRDESGDAKDGYTVEESSGDAATLDVSTVNEISLNRTESPLIIDTTLAHHKPPSSIVIIGVVSAVISVIVLTCIGLILYKYCNSRRSPGPAQFVSIPLNSFRVRHDAVV
jgi:hypothetical protein